MLLRWVLAMLLAESHSYWTHCSGCSTLIPSWCWRSCNTPLSWRVPPWWRLCRGAGRGWGTPRWRWRGRAGSCSQSWSCSSRRPPARGCSRGMSWGHSMHCTQGRQGNCHNKGWRNCHKGPGGNSRGLRPALVPRSPWWLPWCCNVVSAGAGSLLPGHSPLAPIYGFRRPLVAGGAGVTWARPATGGLSLPPHKRLRVESGLIFTLL